MSRSVMYLNNAVTKIFFTVEGLIETEDYSDFGDNLVYQIKKKLKSYEKSEDWDNGETKIILENELCNIGLSEYMGAWSLSVAIKEDEYYSEYGKEALAKYHAEKIKSTLEKCLKNVGARVMNKVATFSNGEAVFEYKK